MKVVLVRSHLREALLKVARAMGDNEKLPILKCVCIEATENQLIITTTNLEIAVICFFSGKVIEKGKVVVPLNILLHIVSLIQGERLNIENKENIFEIIGDNYKATLKCIASDEFPIIPKIASEKEYIEIKGIVLLKAFEQVLSATQFSEVRVELNSTLFNYEIDTIKITGTDGFRLAEKTLTKQQFSSTYNEKFKILFPLKTITELTHIIGDEEIVRISRDEHQVLFKTEKTECISRLVQGNFPEYHALIPKKFTAEIIIDKEEFSNALKLVSALSDRSAEVTLRFLENKKAIELHSRDQSVGDNTYILPAKIIGEAKETVFNWRYLSDAIRPLDMGEVLFGLGENDHPALIKLRKDETYFYIVKPIAR